MKLRRTLAAGLVAVVAVTGLSACSGKDGTTVKIGTTDSEKKVWKVLEEKASEQGINIEMVPFSDYNTPNDALAQGALDLNLFQHLKFLATYNVGADKDLTPIGASEIVPLGLYWKDHENLDGIEGQEVAIPNDSSNQGRAINVLVQAKLVTLKEPNIITPTPADIDEGKSKVTVRGVDAANTTTAFNEGRPAVINNNFLDRAGIEPKQAVFKDDPNSTEAEPYINVFVARNEDRENPTYQKIVEIFHDPEVIQANSEDSRGTNVAVDRPANELADILKRLEDDERQNKS
ncbi:MetQ/NlpA family ABC transporter substrate-binding protein [Corynebacterium uropygiale]|uniref:MetQ/NlpA family ABC transporter substrate-binding protein n=1 Tax=Corynebacterium uropygiale TaxID=1775911 RepID=A0A9X1QME4_9CORY|nr:MetQ/NlpA family ABC transporter substrate-binding protein [Corynebacterium uropygiale]MCF4005982.1 MetQ/NlpA family ABC transporter substrate-binding protein [Corynebacterium uropygiale]